MRFELEATWRSQVADAFARHAENLLRILPNARVEHVGSTAVPGSLTKGDLDICVIVAAADFREAVTRLEQNYVRNDGSDWTEDFAAFIGSDPSPVDVGVQLVVGGSPADNFVRWRELLVAHPDLRRDYDQLKLRHQEAAMDTYRTEKAAFIDAALVNAKDR